MNYKLLIFSVLAFLSCSKNTPVYQPVGGLGKDDLEVSQNRAKQLNQIERKQIEEWITAQKIQKFYPTSLNYWTDIENIEQRPRKKDGETISFVYELYDFDKNKLYKEPKIYENVVFGKFEALDPIENTLRYLETGEETTLLVPSILAYGTYGDGDQIPNDMPLIIKLRKLK